MNREKIILELVQRLPEDVKLHTSGKQVSHLSSFSQKADFKPKGLWYACGDEWIQWAINENYGFGDWVYLVHINMAKMLKLKNAADIREFGAEFEVPRNSSSKSEYYHFNIDWPKVAARYSGIEICPYISSLRLEPEVAWYYGWDVASGCVWDPSALKLELVGHWDGKEFEVTDKSRFAREQQYDTDYFQKRPISPENKWEMPDMGEEPVSEITHCQHSVNPSERGKHLMMSGEVLKVARDLLAVDAPEWVKSAFVSQLNIAGTNLKKYAATYRGVQTWALQSKSKVYKDQYGWVSALWAVNPALDGQDWVVESVLSFAPATSGSLANQKFAEFKDAVQVAGKKDAAMFGVERHVLTVKPDETNALRDVNGAIARHRDDLNAAKKFWKRQTP